MKNVNQEFVVRATQEALARLDIETDIAPETIAGLILEGIAERRWALANGHTLTLLRLFSPIVDREEVFLGGVLLNDFLNKALVRAAENGGMLAIPLIQDLERFFVLLYGMNVDLDTLLQAFREEVIQTLPDLFVGNEDISRGIHGTLERMLTFYKCNIEPFPIFVLPQEILPGILRVIITWLRTLIGEDGPQALAEASNIPIDVATRRRINVVLSLISFFFCLDGREMQSFHYFLSAAAEDGRISLQHIKAAFGIAESAAFEKKAFETAKKDSMGVDFKNLRTAVEPLLQKVEHAINLGSVKDIAPYLDKKMFSGTTEILGDILLSGTHVVSRGFVTETDRDSGYVACRLSGAEVAWIPENNILGGLKTGGRFNQSVRGLSERFGIRSAVTSYLVTRRLGMHFDNGGFPIPKLYNIIFHYGRYENWEVRVLQRQIDQILMYARENKSPQEILKDLADIRQVESSQQRSESEQLPDNPDELVAQLLAMAEDPPPIAEVSTAVAAQFQNDVQSQVLTLGASADRLLVFVLPQLRPGSKEKEDFVQRRFSQSRLAVFTLLAFLRLITGGNGPWYFQSLPRLKPGVLRSSYFYIQNTPEAVERNLHRYSAIADFARRVVKYRDGHSLLAGWIMLADRVLQDPLGIFSDVLQESPIRQGDDSKSDKWTYKRLSNDWDSARSLGLVNLQPYLDLYNELHTMMQEDKNVAKHVPVEQMDEFCDHLFRALDRAALLPVRLNEAAHAFEKYPRMLVGLLSRYHQVEIGFEEWETRILRGMHGSQREIGYEQLQKLRDWLTSSEHRHMFEEVGLKDNLNHLKRSFYGRVYAWLYPRRRLAFAYVDAHRGNSAQFETKTIARDFAGTVAATQQELGLTANDAAIADAQAYVTAKQHYFRTFTQDKKSTT